MTAHPSTSTISVVDTAPGDLTTSDSAASDAGRTDGPLMRFARKLWHRIPRNLRQVSTFALVGGIGWVIDTAIFNVLVLTVLDPASVAGGSLIAKTISTTVAIAFNWIGNRVLTFRDLRQRNTKREVIEFSIASLIGLGAGVGVLWFSREVLGFHTLLADNIAANGVGLIVGAGIRFVLYKFWVYSPKRAHVVDHAATPAASTARA